MRLLLIILFFPIFVLAQDKIDPWPIITDTTTNYDIIDPIQHNFILGWNWGSQGKKLDDALKINFYHNFPLPSNDEYADSIRISQQLQGDVIGGRPQNVIFNTQSLYLEPTINPIHPDSPIEFQPTLRNQNGAVFGFMNKSNEIRYNNDPLNPDFGKVFLYKDSMSALPKVVLNNIWSKSILRYYNHNGIMLNLPKMNGRELFISINLKSLEPITPLNENDVVITIRLPYKIWSDSANSGKGGYKDSNFVKFKNLPSTTDTIQIYDSRGDFRGIRRDTTDSISATPGLREFQITAKMLDALGNGTPNTNITLSAFALFNSIDDGIGGYKWNPILEPDWYEHGADTVYIKDLDLEVTYHGNLNVAIDWIRLETPRARDIYDGKFDHDVYNAAKFMMDAIAAEPTNNPKLMRLYGADELLPHQWGVNRYFNLLLDTLSSSETTLAHNPAGQYIHSTGFKEFWTGDNIKFRNRQSAPYIKYGLIKDSTYLKGGITLSKANLAPDAMNYTFGRNGQFKRTVDTSGLISEIYEYPILDSLNSEYELFLQTGSTNNHIPIPSGISIFDSVDGSSINPYYPSSVQFILENNIYHFYKKQPFMLFGGKPWWANLWVQSEGWKYDSTINSVSLSPWGERPKTGEEINIMTKLPILLGVKGLVYWIKNTSHVYDEIGLAPRNFDPTYLSSLPEGEDLIYTDSLGGDFKQFGTEEPNVRIRDIDTTKHRLDLFGHNGDRIYIGLKSARAELYKLHKWITAVDGELMDLRLQAWHSKGYKEWSEWNQYNSYQHWSQSPLNRIVNLTGVRTRKLFEPKANFIHNFEPNLENRDSSFFDITFLQDKRDTPQDFYNRKKSVYLGIQNRRTDPLLFRDSIDLNPANNFGELMFLSSAEMDSNVRFGGKDLWGIQQNAAWWQDKWWQRLGSRELQLPINLPVYGNGSYILAEELGLSKLDTLGWWFADSLYHRIDTILMGGDMLYAKLLPGQGKIIKLTYVPYFFNDPTNDDDPTNDTCYFCDIFNDLDMFEFNVVAGEITGNSCCYDVSFKYNGKCTFEDIPFRILFTKDSITSYINDIIELHNPFQIHDSLDLRYKYKDTLMSLDSSTGTVSLGTFCLGDTATGYTISLLAGKDKDDKFIGCDREMSFKVSCDFVDKEIKDCCENLSVSDSMYTTGFYFNGNYTPDRYCTILKVNTGFDSDCIYGVTLGNGDVKKNLIELGSSPIDFTSGLGQLFTVCSPVANCIGTEPILPVKMVKMQFLGRDGTIVCEKEVPVWLPCIRSSIADIVIGPGGPYTKSIDEKTDSKTYESETFNVTIWPNPTSGELNVEIDSKLKTEVDINLTNNLGVGISNENGISLNKGKNERFYNLDSYSSGVYYLQIKGKDGNIVLPIILNK